MDIDEQQIKDLLREKELRAEKFTKKERRQLKTPDFRVFKGDNLAFFCEVKTISRDQWRDGLNELVKTVPSGYLRIVGGTRNDSVYNRLNTKIYEAVQQFDAVNPNLEYSNVLAFVNYDRICGLDDLIHVTTGHGLLKQKGWFPLYLQFSEGRIKEKKRRIDLYIWIDKSNKSRFKKPRYFFSPFQKKHLNNLCSCLHIDPNSIDRLRIKSRGS